MLLHARLQHQRAVSVHHARAASWNTCCFHDHLLPQCCMRFCKLAGPASSQACSRPGWAWNARASQHTIQGRLRSCLLFIAPVPGQPCCSRQVQGAPRRQTHIAVLHGTACQDHLHLCAVCRLVAKTGGHDWLKHLQSMLCGLVLCTQAVPRHWLCSVPRCCRPRLSGMCPRCAHTLMS